MKLTGRLKLIADMVPSCNIICDIGTDHAYVPIYLTQNNICKKAVASDVKKGPVIRAKSNIKKYGYNKSIEARIGSGLHNISENECDVIVIAGMGGILIEEILKEQFDKAKKANALILQPMYVIEAVREFLYKNGFYIYDESLVNEGEKIYNVIVAKWTGEIYKKDEIYYYIGEKLIKKNDPLLVKYVKNKIEQVNKIINGLKKSSGDVNNELEKNIHLKGELKKILESKTM